MAPLRTSTIAEQVAAHLREGILLGRWSKVMPGRDRLARELGVSPRTVVRALGGLEANGLLVAQGPCRRRRIVLPKGGPAARPLRVAILGYEPVAERQTEGYMVDLLHLLAAAGHGAFFTDRCLLDLRMDVGRVAGLVGRTEADAWVIAAGSRAVLEWFAAQPAPAFALFGRRRGLPIAGAGPDKVKALRTAARRLIALGHRRIVLLERASRRSAGPGAAEHAMLEEMAAVGLVTGRYNLPDWEDTPEGLQRLLDELCRVTPPTALIIDEPFLFHAAKDHLARRGLLAPEHVSLVCTDPDKTFSWCRPSVAHIRWDSRPVVRRVLRWAGNVSRGIEDRRQTLTKAEYVEGGTVGRAPAMG